MAKKEAKDSKKEEEKAREMQQKYLELQVCDQQLKQVQQQVQQVEQQVAEIEYVSQCLDDMTKIEPGTEVLVPMSSGIFLKAKLVDNKEALINVGGNTTVKKKIPEIKNMLKDQIQDMRKAQEDLANKMQDLARQAAKVEGEVRKLSEA